MITQVQSDNSAVLEFYGKSTDTKPTKDPDDPESKYPPNGSIFYEMNTTKVFMFDGNTKQWIEQ